MIIDSEAIVNVIVKACGYNWRDVISIVSQSEVQKSCWWANKAIIRERHPIPTIDEIIRDVREGNIFSKSDLKWSYHQIQLRIHVARKRSVTYKGMLFEREWCLASPLLQRNISKWKRLEKVLTRLKDRGPSLIKEKYIIYLPKFTFIGLVLWQRTRHWSNGRESRSIETSTWTTESTEVKSFLGLVNSNSRFIPDLTTISEPSRRLIKKEESVCFWSRAAGSLHRSELKRRSAEAESLGSFDCNAETKIIADSSPVGLRTVL